MELNIPKNHNYVGHQIKNLSEEEDVFYFLRTYDDKLLYARYNKINNVIGIWWRLKEIKNLAVGNNKGLRFYFEWSSKTNQLFIWDHKGNLNIEKINDPYQIKVIQFKKDEYHSSMKIDMGAIEKKDFKNWMKKKRKFARRYGFYLADMQTNFVAC